MTQDDRFEDFVRSALNELDPAPVVPREEMWARIDSARRFQRPKKRTTPVWLAWGVGAAALLAVGIGLGRLSVLRQPGQQQVAVQANQPAAANTQGADAGSTPGPQTQGSGRVEAPQPATSSTPYRLAALQHLSRAEVLLAGVRSGTVDREVTMWANDMLASTRMLMDSPAADDPRIGHLLDDLELLLAQIAAAAPAQRNKAELDLIQQGIDQTNVLPRLRATLPANSTAAGT
jgi:hypothetical protein